jgi:hypothetical protein
MTMTQIERMEVIGKIVRFINDCEQIEFDFPKLGELAETTREKMEQTLEELLRGVV